MFGNTRASSINKIECNNIKISIPTLKRHDVVRTKLDEILNLQLTIYLYNTIHNKIKINIKYSFKKKRKKCDYNKRNSLRQICAVKMDDRVVFYYIIPETRHEIRV